MIIPNSDREEINTLKSSVNRMANDLENGIYMTHPDNGRLVKIVMSRGMEVSILFSMRQNLFRIIMLMEREIKRKHCE